MAEKLVKDAQLKKLLAGVVTGIGESTDKKIEAAKPGVATSTKTGLVKGGGTGIAIAADGTISATGTAAVDPSALPLASGTQKGAVMIGSGIDMTDGKISVNEANVKSLAGGVADEKVAAQKFKTVNGASIKGEGDITIDLSLYKVVSSLPATDIDDNKIYLVANTETVPDGELNKYVEYMHVSGKWEKVGEFKTAVDLTPYAKTADLSKYATTNNNEAVLVEIITDISSHLKNNNSSEEAEKFNADLIEAFKDKQDNFVNEICRAGGSYVNETFVKKEELSYMSDADVTAMLGELFPQA